MDATEEIVELDGVVMQAWRRRGIDAMRQEVERQLVAARARRVAGLRRQGRQAYCWGYAKRKTLLTPVGELGPLRVPRMRVDGRELRLIARQVRRVRAFDDLLAEATIGGLSQRRASGWMDRGLGVGVCAATVGRVVRDLGEDVIRRRWRPLDPDEYLALVVDGIYRRYRGGGPAVLLTGLGVRCDGSFDVLDWEPGATESLEVAAALFTRLQRRGWRAPELLVADAAGAVAAARELVFPGTLLQPCLWHWSRVLGALVPLVHRRAFYRDFWEVYNGLDIREVADRAATFRRHWRALAGAAVASFEAQFARTLGFLHYPATWRHRLRTVNLAEGFFRNFRRFFNRFPGFGDERHLARCLGLYLLAVRPERWQSASRRRIA